MTPCPSDSNSLVLPRPTRQPAFVNFSDKRSTGVDQKLSDQESFYFVLPLKEEVIDIMAARKTIVFLVGYLLIGWVVWIIVNFI